MESMLDELSRPERLLLLKFACAFAWTDLRVKDSEKSFVRRLVARFGLEPEDRAQVEQWLHVAPAPSELDPSLVPAEHRRTFLEAARAVIYADGEVDAEEREQLERLKAALGV
jgi:tellurite resistance protein